MKYALTLVSSPSSHGPSLLEDGQSRVSVAADCRSAALDFMAGVADGWTKLNLALWLHGPYALAARHSQVGDRAPSAPCSGRRSLPPKTIEDLLVQTRLQLLASLELAALHNGCLDFIETAIVEGHVRRAVNNDGESIWVPVDVARMRLRDRVASLFVADYLNDPSGYEHLYVCHHCEAVVFEPGAREHGMCSAHNRVSLVVPRGERHVRASRPRTLAYGE